MPINKKLNENLIKIFNEDGILSDENSGPIVISSGRTTKEATMSLGEALKILVEYAKKLEESKNEEQ